MNTETTGSVQMLTSNGSTVDCFAKMAPSGVWAGNAQQKLAQRPLLPSNGQLINSGLIARPPRAIVH